MAATVPRIIDAEWANSLIGLPMAVPEYWWVGLTASTLYHGTIIGTHSNNYDLPIFQLQTEEEPNAIYEIEYRHVGAYANEEHRDFDKYRLPATPISCPLHEVVEVRRRPRGRNLLVSHEPSSPASSSDDDNEEPRTASYRLTDPNDWHRIINDDDIRLVEPIPFTGGVDGEEDFTVNISIDELLSLMDESDDIRFPKVFEHLLPRYGDDNFWQFLAARMQNYMIHIMRDEENPYKPRYYNPTPDPNNPKDIKKVITPDHVARFFGCHMARMLKGFPSIDETWSTRESLSAVGAVIESMPQDAYIDIYRCMHFSDDFDAGDDIEWEAIYDNPKYAPTPDSPQHQKKFGHIEDGFNRRWKECVNFGKWVTMDESRVAGWYHSCITMGPEPKPIRTGATIHSLCITHGELSSYKLHCRVYGGASDEGLSKRHALTGTVQKWITLYDEMLDAFKDEGHCCTMDSAYMGDAMAQIGHEIWKVNMVGTAQISRTGADAEEARKGMKIGTYESIMFQHNTKPLCYAMWSDGAIVKTLSNFHSPKILVEGTGMLRKKKGPDGRRERVQSEVPCPEQNKSYSDTFHLIDKGNGAEANYDMGGHSKTHNWAPKLTMRYFNMNFNNTMQIYKVLMAKHNEGKHVLTMPQCIMELAHTLMQRGEDMRQRAAVHPTHSRDLTNVSEYGCGRKRRSDAKGTVSRAVQPAPKIMKQNKKLQDAQRKHPWRVHQSMATNKRKRCCWQDCPGRTEYADRNPCWTIMKCEECSIEARRDIYLCNNAKKGNEYHCHTAYHTAYHKKKFKSDGDDR